MRFLKKFLIGIYIFLAVYSTAALVLYIFTGNEPVVLTGCVFGVVGAESLIGCYIKACGKNSEK